MVWGPQWRGLYLTLACVKIGKNTFSAFSAMAFKGNRFNGQLQTTTKLFNGTLQCYDSALLFRKRWFLLFGNNPFPLLIRKSCVPNFLRDQRPQYLSARLDLSEDTITFTLCLRGKKRREARNCSPVCCHFFSPYTFPIFLVYLSAQNFKAMETGCWLGKEGELCAFSRKDSWYKQRGPFHLKGTDWETLSPSGLLITGLGNPWLELSSQNDFLKMFNPLQRFVNPRTWEMDLWTTNQNKVERSA